MFDADVLPYGEKKCVNMLSRFHLIPERHGQTDGRTDRQADRQTDRIAKNETINFGSRSCDAEYTPCLKKTVHFCRAMLQARPAIPACDHVRLLGLGSILSQLI